MKVNLTIGIPAWLDRIFTWPVMLYRRQKYGYDFRKIYLGEGQFTIVEPQDYYRLSNFKWRLLGNGWNFYAVRDVKTGPFRTKVSSMHREIMNAPAGLLVDHENSDSLDNRKANLRLATHFQNSCNRRKTRAKTSSRFIGVCFDKNRGRWIAYTKLRGKRIWLGRFKNEIDAAKAYDIAAKKYHGEFARLNFPDEPYTRLPRNTIYASRTTRNYHGKRHTGFLMNRAFRVISCGILLTILVFAGCVACKKTADSRSKVVATTKMTLKDAKAQSVWEIFRRISAVPRCSKNNSQIIEWLKGFARQFGLVSRTDSAGNTVIELPATGGHENTPTVVLQSHVDMVCEKTPESKHDFTKDPIEIIERDGWVCADGTTLGADDGLGMALALALTTEKLPHPRLELLFTVDEEIGLTGANALQQGFITGKYLINLDGEDTSIIVGCAGGENTEFTVPLNLTEAPRGLDCFTLKVSGLYGGHSGVDIDKGRANAIKILVETLRALEGLSSEALAKEEQFDLKLCRLDGGRASNAIPRDANAVILLDPSRLDAVRDAIAGMESSFKNNFSATDPNLKIELHKATEHTEKKIINNQLSIINLLSAFPTGVYRMSDEFKGTVETSNNLARVETVLGENLLRITSMQRGFEQTGMDELTGKIVAIAKQAGAEVKASERYPSWWPDIDSSLLKQAKATYRKLNKDEPQVRVVHAGLEPAFIAEKFPGIEMISVGPTIENPHSPQERLNIASVDNVWGFLLALLPSLK